MLFGRFHRFRSDFVSNLPGGFFPLAPTWAKVIRGSSLKQDALKTFRTDSSKKKMLTHLRKDEFESWINWDFFLKLFVFFCFRWSTSTALSIARPWASGPSGNLLRHGLWWGDKREVRDTENEKSNVRYWFVIRLIRYNLNILEHIWDSVPVFVFRHVSLFIPDARS